jgi:hypothetical protein
MEKQASVSRWLGINKCNTLCRLSQVPSEADLPPTWCDFAKVKSEDRLGLFKGRVQSELCKMGERYNEYYPSGFICQEAYFSGLENAQHGLIGSWKSLQCLSLYRL